ncbi:alpha/beta fold hydrolase [Euzebya tangerina]|uniref:alpha/beta fold hydrolase n=1 Tax=Euzebya tangerina TaxID=591198 RepID=UPI000E31B4EA|nr:alpha/beta fold hydrolase [Euzebya tangerina]
MTGGDSPIDVGAEGQQTLRPAGGTLLEDRPALLKRSGVLNVGRQRVRMSLVNEGAGRPLLLINGIGATGDLFDDFRVHITDRETIAFDVPGVGGSPAPTWPWRIRWYARVVAEMINELGHSSVDVLGLSWGGALAQELARRHPDRVRRLVLVATTPGVISLPGRPSALAVLMTPWRYYSPAYLQAVAPTLYGGQVRDHPEMMNRHSQVRSTRPPSVSGYVCQLSALRRWTSLPWLRTLPMRTLVLAGDDDPIIPLRNAKMMASRIPQARLYVVKGGGHLFLFTQAAAMADRVTDFLDA